ADGGRPEKRRPAAALWNPDRDTPEGRSLRGFVRVAPARYEQLEPAAPGEKYLSATSRASRFRRSSCLTKRGLRSDRVRRRSVARPLRSSRRRRSACSQTAPRCLQKWRPSPPDLSPPWRSGLRDDAPSGGTAATRRNADRSPPFPLDLRGERRGAFPTRLPRPSAGLGGDPWIETP